MTPKEAALRWQRRMNEAGRDARYDYDKFIDRSQRIDAYSGGSWKCRTCGGPNQTGSICRWCKGAKQWV